MIATLVQFPLPKPMTRDQAAAVFSSTAPNYTKVPGLIRKHYVLSEDGRSAGGMYIWKTRQDAQALYTDEWARFIADKYGAQPTVTYFECPVVVDNIAGNIVAD